MSSLALYQSTCYELCSLLVSVVVFSVYFEHGCLQCWETNQGMHEFRVSGLEVHNSTVCRPKFHIFVGTEIGLWN
jgi:hypothetical protein